MSGGNGKSDLTSIKTAVKTKTFKRASNYCSRLRALASDIAGNWIEAAGDADCRRPGCYVRPPTPMIIC